MQTGRRLIEDWCRRNTRDLVIANEPDVVARRVISWIVNAGFLLEDADERFYALFTKRLGRELRRVDLVSRSAYPGYSLLACRLALVLATLALAGHDSERRRLESALLSELDRQVLPDGGHVSRNPETIVEILLDLLPIRQCYTSRGLEIPAVLSASIAAMLGHLRSMLIGPAELARFNGVTSANAEALASVLAVDPPGPKAGTQAPGPSGYARLEAGDTVLIADCGRSPPLLHSGSAHAGCLSIELSYLGEALIVNGGAPAALHRLAAPDARATASHSTLVIAEQSSARLVRNQRIEQATGGIALAGIEVSGVRLEQPEPPDTATIVAAHSGYFDRTGLVHERHITLSADGRRLDGVDGLRPPTGTLRLAKDLPVAIHFHVAPTAVAQPEADGSVSLIQANGARWRLSASGNRLAIEAATSYSSRLGPASARQVVLRATTAGESRFEWCLACI
ncbi:MAG: heparinase II/III family protein [Proteobacteria bacterium]|nr:heparinase II/III family protein [Pseudomonadota bacterium]